MMVHCAVLPPPLSVQLEYGYALQQHQLGATTFKVLMEGFPDHCYYKAHQRNTLVMHPSPVMHLRLLLRMVLAPVKAAVQKQQNGAGAAANGAATTAAGTAAATGSGEDAEGPSSSDSGKGKILAVVEATNGAAVIGGCIGFSAATARYAGCPANAVRPALDRLAAAVEAALSSVAGSSMAIEGPGGEKVYPVVAVQQAFEAVYGYSMPLYRLGSEHFKQLLLELDGECSLTPKHKLTGEPPPNVPEVWFVTPPVPDRAGRQSVFNELYLKRLAAAQAMPLNDWEPTPVGAAGAAASGGYGSGTGYGSAGMGYGSGSTGPGGGYKSGGLIPALGGSTGGGSGYSGGSSSGGRAVLGSRYGSGGSGDSGRQWGGGSGAAGGGGSGGGPRAQVMAAVVDLLRRRLAAVPNAYGECCGTSQWAGWLGSRAGLPQSSLCFVDAFGWVGLAAVPNA